MLTRCITVDADAGMPTIVALRDQLLAAITPDHPVRLDLSAVADPHLCIVQLILAARHHAAATEADFALAVPATPAIARTLERAGLAPRTPDDITFWMHGDTFQ